MKKSNFDRDVDEAVDEIEKLLTKYNVKVCYDLELETIILIDQDNRDFKVISRTLNEKDFV